MLDKAMFRYIEDGEETYRYKPDKNTKKLVAYFPPEHEMSLSEELIELQRKQKQLLDRINHMIGKQNWVRYQNGTINEGGQNQVPRQWDNEKGYNNNPFKRRKKK